MPESISTYWAKDLRIQAKVGQSFEFVLNVKNDDGSDYVFPENHVAYFGVFRRGLLAEGYLAETESFEVLTFDTTIEDGKITVKKEGQFNPFTGEYSYVLFTYNPDDYGVNFQDMINTDDTKNYHLRLGWLPLDWNPGDTLHLVNSEGMENLATYQDNMSEGDYYGGLYYHAGDGSATYCSDSPWITIAINRDSGLSSISSNNSFWYMFEGYFGADDDTFGALQEPPYSNIYGVFLGDYAPAAENLQFDVPDEYTGAFYPQGGIMSYYNLGDQTQDIDGYVPFTDTANLYVGNDSFMIDQGMLSMWLGLNIQVKNLVKCDYVIPGQSWFTYEGTMDDLYSTIQTRPPEDVVEFNTLNYPEKNEITGVVSYPNITMDGDAFEPYETPWRLLNPSMLGIPHITPSTQEEMDMCAMSIQNWANPLPNWGYNVMGAIPTPNQDYITKPSYDFYQNLVSLNFDYNPGLNGNVFPVPEGLDVEEWLNSPGMGFDFGEEGSIITFSDNNSEIMDYQTAYAPFYWDKIVWVGLDDYVLNQEGYENNPIDYITGLPNLPSEYWPENLVTSEPFSIISIDNPMNWLSVVWSEAHYMVYLRGFLFNAMHYDDLTIDDNTPLDFELKVELVEPDENGNIVSFVGSQQVPFSPGHRTMPETIMNLYESQPSLYGPAPGFGDENEVFLPHQQNAQYFQPNELSYDPNDSAFSVLYGEGGQFESLFSGTGNLPPTIPQNPQGAYLNYMYYYFQTQYSGPLNQSPGFNMNSTTGELSTASAFNSELINGVINAELDYRELVAKVPPGEKYRLLYKIKNLKTMSEWKGPLVEEYYYYPTVRQYWQDMDYVTYTTWGVITSNQMTELLDIQDNVNEEAIDIKFGDLQYAAGFLQTDLELLPLLWDNIDTGVNENGDTLEFTLPDTVLENTFNTAGEIIYQEGMSEVELSLKIHVTNYTKIASSSLVDWGGNVPSGMQQDDDYYWVSPSYVEGTNNGASNFNDRMPIYFKIVNQTTGDEFDMGDIFQYNEDAEGPYFPPTNSTIGGDDVSNSMTFNYYTSYGQEVDTPLKLPLPDNLGSNGDIIYFQVRLPLIKSRKIGGKHSYLESIGQEIDDGSGNIITGTNTLTNQAGSYYTNPWNGYVAYQSVINGEIITNGYPSAEPYGGWTFSWAFPEFSPIPVDEYYQNGDQNIYVPYINSAHRIQIDMVALAISEWAYVHEQPIEGAGIDLIDDSIFNDYTTHTSARFASYWFSDFEHVDPDIVPDFARLAFSMRIINAETGEIYGQWLDYTNFNPTEYITVPTFLNVGYGGAFSQDEIDYINNLYPGAYDSDDSWINEVTIAHPGGFELDTDDEGTYRLGKNLLWTLSLNSEYTPPWAWTDIPYIPPNTPIQFQIKLQKHRKLNDEIEGFFRITRTTINSAWENISYINYENTVPVKADYWLFGDFIIKK